MAFIVAINGIPLAFAHAGIAPADARTATLAAGCEKRAATNELDLIESENKHPEALSTEEPSSVSL